MSVFLSRARNLALLLMTAGLLAGCRSLGREVNQALPEFLRSDPGAEEIERFEIRRRVYNRTPEDIARARQEFELGRTLFEDGQYDTCIDTLVLYLENYPDTPEDKEARFILLNAHLKNDEYSDARRTWRSFLANYPVSEYGQRLEQIGYDMAQSYLRGEQDFLFFSEASEGIKLLDDLVRHFPAGNFADDARWETGNYWFEDEDWIQAQTSYAQLVENHPDSPWAGRGQYNVGLCRLNRVKGAEYDERNMLDAIESFRDYLAKFPEGDRVVEAEQHIRDLRELLSEKHLTIARWYLGQDKPRAARFFLMRGRRLYPETTSALEATELLESLPEEGPGDLPENATPEELTPATQRVGVTNP